jgi:hypothetical protein
MHGLFDQEIFFEQNTKLALKYNGIFGEGKSFGDA